MDFQMGTGNSKARPQVASGPCCPSISIVAGGGEILGQVFWGRFAPAGCPILSEAKRGKRELRNSKPVLSVARASALTILTRSPLYRLLLSRNGESWTKASLPGSLPIRAGLDCDAYSGAFPASSPRSRR